MGHGVREVSWVGGRGGGGRGIEKNARYREENIDYHSDSTVWYYLRTITRASGISYTEQ